MVRKSSRSNACGLEVEACPVCCQPVHGTGPALPPLDAAALPQPFGLLRVLSCRADLVVKHARLPYGGQEEVVRQELQAPGGCLLLYSIAPTFKALARPLRAPLSC